MNTRRSNRLSSTMLGLSLVASSVFAANAYASEEVDINTPDSVLLSGNNAQLKQGVFEPGEQLILSIEGIDHDIHIRSNVGETVLHATNVDRGDVVQIRRTYEAISDHDFTIKTHFSNQELEETRTTQAAETRGAYGVESDS